MRKRSLLATILRQIRQLTVVDIVDIRATTDVVEHSLQPSPVVSLVDLPAVPPQMEDTTTRVHLIEHSDREIVPIPSNTTSRSQLPVREFERGDDIGGVAIGMHGGINVITLRNRSDAPSSSSCYSESSVMHHDRVLGAVRATRIAETPQRRTDDPFQTVLALDNLTHRGRVGQRR